MPEKTLGEFIRDRRIELGSSAVSGRYPATIVVTPDVAKI
jgi:hypothetical protein